MGGQYVNGGVLIPHTGWYTIYSSFTLSSEGNKKENIITHKFLRRRANGKVNGADETVLQKNTRLESGEFVHDVNFLLGNVHLGKGDFVHPWLSNVSTVYKMSIMSRWGLFALKLE